MNLICYAFLCGPFSFYNHLDKEEKAACFVLIVFLMSRVIKFSAALPYSALGWSAVCDCGIS